MEFEFKMDGKDYYVHYTTYGNWEEPNKFEVLDSETGEEVSDDAVSDKAWELACERIYEESFRG